MFLGQKGLSKPIGNHIVSIDPVKFDKVLVIDLSDPKTLYVNIP
jgi:hypothetical protein